MPELIDQILSKEKVIIPLQNGHSPILGLEVSGIVYKVGAKVKDFKKGDEVAALVNGGGYAEYCATDQLTTFKIPKNISLKEAAGIPECFLLFGQIL